MKTLKVKRKHESGQAIAELCISLIAILAIFVGFLFTVALGVENVQNLIFARGKADQLAANNGATSIGGSPVIAWDYGDDELKFTSDDYAIHGSTRSIETYNNELGNDDITLSELDDSYVKKNFSQTIGSPLFYQAAQLTSYESINKDPLEDKGLTDMVEVFRALILDTPDFTLKETVYMPRTQD